ncbi:MAG: sugar ABC transporter ATP-binding protein [Spirochaetia bacterium]
MASTHVLETHNINKSYPGVQALKDVDFELKRGEVHALVGQNGAGKSTFVEIIAGSIQPDNGVINLDERRYPFLDPWLSIDLGVQTVHQENQLVEELTVAENIFLYDLPQTKLGFVNLPTCVETADKLMAELDIDIKTNQKLSDLTFVERKLVSIAKAFSRKAKILILDEPTASLDEGGKEVLFDLIRKYSERGLSTIYISHHLSEIFEVCDRVTVFKDGIKVATHAIGEVEMNTIIKEMIGKESSTLYVRDKAAVTHREENRLEVKDYYSEGVVDHVSFSVGRGEIFGLGGLVGSGRTELARLIFGLDRKDSGRLVFEGRDITPRSPWDAIEKGLGYLTEDRKDNGLVLIRPIFENVSLVKFAKTRKRGLLNLKDEKDRTTRVAVQLDVKTPTISQKVINLSGGNQ